MIGIVGAGGFIGQSLSRYLTRCGQPHIGFFRRDVVENDPGSSSLMLHRIMLLGEPLKPNLLNDVDHIVLCVSATKPNVVDDIGVEISMNVLPHWRFLMELRETGVKHLTYLSSGGAVYGNSIDFGRIDENSPCRPITSYGFGKLSIESLINVIWQGDGRRSYILRPSNPVGSIQLLGKINHGLVATVFRRLSQNLPVTVFGDGSTVRDYFSVDDLCRLIMLIDQIRPDENLILNSGAGVGHSIIEVIEKIALVLGRTPEIVYKGAMAQPVKFSVLDCAKAARVVGWFVTKNFEELVEELVISSKLNSGGF